MCYLDPSDNDLKGNVSVVRDRACIMRGLSVETYETQTDRPEMQLYIPPHHLYSLLFIIVLTTEKVFKKSVAERV